MESFHAVAIDKHLSVSETLLLSEQAGVWKTRDLHVSLHTAKNHPLTVMKELLRLRVAKNLEQRDLSNSRSRTLPEILKARTDRMALAPSVFPAPLYLVTRLSCFVLAEPPNTHSDTSWVETAWEN